MQTPNMNLNNVIYPNTLLIDIINNLQNVINDIYKRKTSDYLIGEINSIIVKINKIANENNKNINKGNVNAYNFPNVNNNYNAPIIVIFLIIISFQIIIT